MIQGEGVMGVGASSFPVLWHCVLLDFVAFFLSFSVKERMALLILCGIGSK